MKKLPRKFYRAGFTLVEVALAVGIVSFAMLGVLGTLSVGLQSVRDSVTDTARANIAGHVRGELQRIPFAENQSGTYNIDTLSQETYYYNRDGLLTTATDPRAFYKADFLVKPAGVVGASGASNFQPESARNITVTLRYPASATSEAQQTSVFSIFSAKQKNG